MFGLFGGKTSYVPLTISMDKAQSELENDKDIVLVDVRNPDEYRQGHIKNSVNLPLGNLAEGLAQKVPDKVKRIFVYCLSGNRSGQAVNWMMRNGYGNVVNIGGITSWSGPVVRG